MDKFIAAVAGIFELFKKPSTLLLAIRRIVLKKKRMPHLGILFLLYGGFSTFY